MLDVIGLLEKGKELSENDWSEFGNPWENE